MCVRRALVSGLRSISGTTSGRGEYLLAKALFLDQSHVAMVSGRTNEQLNACIIGWFKTGQILQSTSHFNITPNRHSFSETNCDHKHFWKSTRLDDQSPTRIFVKLGQTIFIVVTKRQAAQQHCSLSIISGIRPVGRWQLCTKSAQVRWRFATGRTICIIVSQNLILMLIYSQPGPLHVNGASGEIP